MRMLNKKKGKRLSIILAISLLVGMVPMSMVSKASTDSDMKLLASTGDTIPWTTYVTSPLESSTLAFDEATPITKLRLQITKLSSWKKYKIFEVEILNNEGTNIASQATVEIFGSMTSKDIADWEEGELLVDGVKYKENGTTASDYSYLERTGSSTRTPTDEYIEFTFSEKVTVSQITLFCSWCNNGSNGGDAPFAWEIYGNPSKDVPSDLTWVGERVGIEWPSDDETAETQSVVFDNPISLDKLRVYIDEINQYKSYSILELEIYDEEGNNIAPDATITDSSSTSAANIAELTNGATNGNWGKYERSGLASSTPLNEYIDFAFGETVKVKEVRMYCWYGNSALKAFSVYASLVEPTLAFLNDEYQVNEEEKIVHQVPAGTTALEFMNQIDSVKLLENDIKLTTQDGTLITDDKSTLNLQTGTKVVVYDTAGDILSYDIAVFGDVDCDGEATIADTVLTKQYEDEKATLTLLQQYAAGRSGTQLVAESGALTWYLHSGTESEKAQITFDTVPRDITKLRVYINDAGKYKNYSISEIKLYDENGTNVAHKNYASVSVNTHMQTEKLSYVNDGYENYWSTYSSYTYDLGGLSDDYIEFTWTSPVTVCSYEMICFYGNTNAPRNLDIRCDFGDLSISRNYVNSQALKNYVVQMGTLYSEEYFNSVAETVASHETATSLSLGFITDTHIDNQATYGYPSLSHLLNATKLANMAELDGLIHGGDLIDGGYVKNRSMSYISRGVSTLVSTSKVPIFMTQGNHDDNSMYLMKNNTADQHIKAEDWYWAVTRNLEQYGIVQNPDDPYGNYYYQDFEDSKIRVIFVNTNDLPYVLNEDGTVKYLATNGDFAIGNKQLNWIADTALNFTDKGGDAGNWAVLVMSHVYLYNPKNVTNQPCKNSWILTEMLEAFKNGTAYTSEASTGDFAQSVTVDFTSQGAMEVIACIAGHNHLDLNAEVNGIQYITTAASLANQRPYGTIEEDAFDIFTIDRETKKIYATRFGAGEDREFAY